MARIVKSFKESVPIWPFAKDYFFNLQGKSKQRNKQKITLQPDSCRIDKDNVEMSPVQTLMFIAWVKDKPFLVEANDVLVLGVIAT